VRAPYRERLRKIPPPSGDALSHGLAMVVAPTVLGLLGAWFDSLAGTSPLFLIALAAFGVAGSFASAFYRYEQKISRHDAGKPWTRRAVR
jgi:F0F1-type ATP synthase assembly protein I